MRICPNSSESWTGWEGWDLFIERVHLDGDGTTLDLKHR